MCGLLLGGEVIYHEWSTLGLDLLKHVYWSFFARAFYWAYLLCAFFISPLPTNGRPLKNSFSLSFSIFFLFHYSHLES